MACGLLADTPEAKYDSKTSKGAREDALALNGEEGRGKLRKAAGTGKHGLIRRCPNGATRVVEDYSHRKMSTRRELKHLSTCRNRKQS